MMVSSDSRVCMHHGVDTSHRARRTLRGAWEWACWHHVVHRMMTPGGLCGQQGDTLQGRPLFPCLIKLCVRLWRSAHDQKYLRAS